MVFNPMFLKRESEDRIGWIDPLFEEMKMDRNSNHRKQEKGFFFHLDNVLYNMFFSGFFFQISKKKNEKSKRKRKKHELSWI